MAVVEQTSQAPPGRAALVAVAGVLWLLGWLVGKVCVATVWVWAALQVGWLDARARRR